MERLQRDALIAKQAMEIAALQARVRDLAGQNDTLAAALDDLMSSQLKAVDQRIVALEKAAGITCAGDPYAVPTMSLADRFLAAPRTFSTKGGR